jgi:hypothetical protein
MALAMRPLTFFLSSEEIENGLLHESATISCW